MYGNRRSLSGALMLLGLMAFGCQWDVGSLDIRTVYSAVEGQKPFDPERVERVRVRVEGQDMSPRVAEVQLGESLRVHAVPVGEHVRVVVEGLGSIGVVSRGVSLPFEVQAGNNAVFVFTSPVGASSEPPNVTSSKYPDWQEGYRISMRSPRAFHQATVLADGSVLVTGGTAALDLQDYLLRLSPGQGLRLAERFDPSAGAFFLDDPGTVCSASLCMQSGRAYHHVLAPAAIDGVLVIGGEPVATDAELSTESYSLLSRDFQEALALNTPRSRHAAAALVDAPNEVLVAGGLDRTGEMLSSVELINMEQGSVAEVGQLAVPRVGAEALAACGGVLVIGGWEVFGTDGEGQVLREPSARIERIRLSGGVAQIESLRSLRIPRAELSVTLLSDGETALVCGGVADFHDLIVEAAASCERVTCAGADGEQEALEHEMRSPRWAHRATLLPDGKVLISGGFNPGLSPAAYRSAEIINPANGYSERQPTLKRGRGAHSATLMPNGMVLILGGSSGGAEMPGLDYEIYNPIYNP